MDDQENGNAGTSKTSPAEVPILIYGADNNFPVFHQLLSMVASEIWEPDEIDPEDIDLENDPHKLNLEELREAIKSRKKTIAKIEVDEPSVYAFIYRHLSNESLDAIKLLQDYGKFHYAKDPVLLWLGIMETHKVASTSTVPSVLKADSRAKYQAIHQGSFESIVGYKERFDTALEGYNDMKNPEMAAANVAMDFIIPDGSG